MSAADGLRGGWRGPAVGRRGSETRGEGAGGCGGRGASRLSPPGSGVGGRPHVPSPPGELRLRWFGAGRGGWRGHRGLRRRLGEKLCAGLRPRSRSSPGPVPPAVRSGRAHPRSRLPGSPSRLLPRSQGRAAGEMTLELGGKPGGGWEGEARIFRFVAQMFIFSAWCGSSSNPLGIMFLPCC